MSRHCWRPGKLRMHSYVIREFRVLPFSVSEAVFTASMHKKVQVPSVRDLNRRRHRHMSLRLKTCSAVTLFFFRVQSPCCTRDFLLCSDSSYVKRTNGISFSLTCLPLWRHPAPEKVHVRSGPPLDSTALCSGAAAFPLPSC